MRGRSRLALTHTRLTQWRAQHGGRGIPVPEELWAEVVKVARVEGVGPTARALRLDRLPDDVLGARALIRAARGHAGVHGEAPAELGPEYG